MKRRFFQILLMPLITLTHGTFSADSLKDVFSLDHPTQKTILLAKENIKAAQSLLQQSLRHVKTAELHFFWASGRMESYPQFGGPSTVDVGGSKYKDKFPVYVKTLLDNAPDSLRIKFVCDQLTYDTNKIWLEDLCGQYGDKFEILEISQTKDKLIQRYPNQKHLLDVIFLNAMQGNPVIPSDIYRLVGMVWGHDFPLEKLLEAQFTYCDIDTFCFGMESTEHISQPDTDLCLPRDYESSDEDEKKGSDQSEQKIQKNPDPLGYECLIKALFCEAGPSSNELFYLARPRRANDIIKLRVRNPDAYDEFCNNLLQKVEKLNILYNDLLGYFPKLYTHIQACGENPIEGFQGYLNTFSTMQMRVKTIMHLTGPSFAAGLKLQEFEHEIPVISELSWHNTWALEDDFYGWPTKALPSLENARKRHLHIDEIFKLYSTRVFEASFAQRFGQNHAFTLKLCDYLKCTFPFATKEFKLFLQDAYNTSGGQIGFNHTDKQQNTYKQQKDWIKLVFSMFTEDFSRGGTAIPYYLNLKNVLERIGVTIPFTAESIDFETKLTEVLTGTGNGLQIRR
jgi:hypothetical protein